MNPTGGEEDHYHNLKPNLKQALFCFILVVLTQGFSVALGPFLVLALVDQAGLELTEIHPPPPRIKGVHHHCLDASFNTGQVGGPWSTPFLSPEK